jgi:hypothetical protein
VGTYGKEEDEYGWCTLYAYMKCNNVGKKWLSALNQCWKSLLMWKDRKAK